MLTNDNISLNNLISLSATGLNVATFSQIKEALIAQYKFIYGTDIDVDDTTADGVFINTNALIINNILQTMSAMYSNLDINTASGQYLDILCALSNVERKSATRSNTNLQITYLGSTTVTYTPDQLTFIDKAGLEWAPTQNYSFKGNETKVVYVECKKLGPVTAPAGWIYQIIDASIPILVSQNEIANVGQDKESDFNLRSRKTSSGSGAGITTLSSLQGQLLAISGINDVKILNNNSDSSLTCDDDVVMAPHSIYIILRQQKGITIPDEQVGKIIYSKLTPGISTTEFTGSGSWPKSYEYVSSISNVSSSILNRQYVYWKLCAGITPIVTIKLTPYSYFSEDEFNSIASYLMSYFNNLKIGELPSSMDISIQAVYADPKFKGMATYAVNSATINLAKNKLEYYTYSTFEKTKNDDGTYTLTLN